MEIIGAGLDRTGTLSLQHALQILGYDTYHWEEHVEKHLSFWGDVYSGKNQCPDFATEYAGVQAITDLPAAYFFEEFLQAFPDARVILTIRDDEEKWYKSFLQHNKDTTFVLSKYVLGPSVYRIIVFAENMRRVIYGGTLSSLICKKKYRQHIEFVKSVVPADKLLVFNVKEGWKPLCEFLGKDIPSEPFPSSNQTGVVGDGVRKMTRQGFIRAGFVFGFLISITSFAVWKLRK